MPTDRKFSAFNPREENPPPFRMRQVPDGGLCLSSFVLLSDEGDDSTVLLGKLDPAAPWDHIGALDPERASKHSKGWMIPSCHMLIHESPQQAAQRILREQLDMNDLTLAEPKVVSEVDRMPPRFLDHWDIEFIFTGEVRHGAIRKPTQWKELMFVRVPSIRRSDMARRHEDILESAGFKFSG